MNMTPSSPQQLASFLFEPVWVGSSPLGEKTMEDRWLSVDEIGAYLGVKRDTVYKWIGEKAMPAHRIGRLWKFKIVEVDEWVRRSGARETHGTHDKNA
jgi:excisionase family DNA binding protein